MDWKKIAKKGVPIVFGAGLGFAYYYFIGCRSGACPITSNPWISTAYGALVGALFAMNSRKKTAD